MSLISPGHDCIWDVGKGMPRSFPRLKGCDDRPHLLPARGGALVRTKSVGRYTRFVFVDIDSLHLLYLRLCLCLPSVWTRAKVDRLG
jgi:hypothetical protein